ncbi:MAG: hypothetical protein ACLFOY_00455 [Desulfatibacillaceae bacterium]
MSTKVYDELVKSWPAPLVARGEVARFSGGALRPKTMANLDSLGQGPPALRMGKKIVYRTADLARFVADRITEREGRQGSDSRD